MRARMPYPTIRIRPWWNAMSARVRALSDRIRSIIRAPAGRRELALLASLLAYHHTRAMARLLRRPPLHLPTDRWLTPHESAALMGVSPKWLHRRRTRLPFIHPLRCGRGWRASLRELQAWMRARQ